MNITMEAEGETTVAILLVEGTIMGVVAMLTAGKGEENILAAKCAGVLTTTTIEEEEDIAITSDGENGNGSSLHCTKLSVLFFVT